MNPDLQGMSRFPVTRGFEKILTFPPRTGSIWFALHASRDIERLLADGFFRDRTEPD
jgi:hypothetical protein